MKLEDFLKTDEADFPDEEDTVEEKDGQGVYVQMGDLIVMREAYINFTKGHELEVHYRVMVLIMLWRISLALSLVEFFGLLELLSREDPEPVQLFMHAQVNAHVCVGHSDFEQALVSAHAHNLIARIVESISLENYTVSAENKIVPRAPVARS